MHIQASSQTFCKKSSTPILGHKAAPRH